MVGDEERAARSAWRITLRPRLARRPLGKPRTTVPFRPARLGDWEIEWDGRREPTCSGYIIPLMSGIPPPPPFLSAISATIASVVRMFFAIEAAFCKADRVTIAGS